MPTLPSTCVPREPDIIVPGIHNSLSLQDAPSQPTPDPDLDDVVLVPVVTGDGMGAITSASSLRGAPDHTNPELKPRLSLNNLSLHSPSSILGTPFDVSEPPFEYPFPTPIPDPGFFPTAAIPGLGFAGHLSSSVSPAAILTPMPGSLPSCTLTRSESHKLSPLHPKLQARDPPVPPSLAKKGWNTGITAPPPPTPLNRSTTRARQLDRGTPSKTTKNAISVDDHQASPSGSSKSKANPPSWG